MHVIFQFPCIPKMGGKSAAAAAAVAAVAAEETDGVKWEPGGDI